MRASLTVIFLLFLNSTLTLSQTPRTARSQQVTKSQATNPFDTTPFNFKVTKLPKDYIGHPLHFLFASLAEWQKAARKSEFETTTEYQERLAKYKKKILYGTINFDSPVAIALRNVNGSQLTSSYDADSGILSVKLNLRHNALLGNFDHPYYVVEWAEASKRVSSYVGSNVFNRHVRVQVYRDDEYYLALPALDLESFPELRTKNDDNYTHYLFDKTINFNLKMGPDEARAIKPNLRILIIGFFDNEPAYYISGRDTPEIDDPYDRYEHSYYLKIIPDEIWLYDVSSGVVYSRMIADPPTKN